MNLKIDRPLVFFDLETTGTQIHKDRIVELYALKYLVNGSTEEFYSRFNPGIPIPPEVSAVHGITNEDVAFEPYFKDIGQQVKDFFGGCDLGGYNIIRFDVPFLVEEFLRNGIDDPFSSSRFIDPMVIFHRKVSRSLSGAMRYYRNEELEDAHTAKADVLATVKVLESQLERHEDLPSTSQGIHDFVTQGRSIVDYSGFFTRNKSEEIVFNFGKNKGKLLRDEPGYLSWMISNDFPENTKKVARQILAEQ